MRLEYPEPTPADTPKTYAKKISRSRQRVSQLVKAGRIKFKHPRRPTLWAGETPLKDETIDEMEARTGVPRSEIEYRRGIYKWRFPKPKAAYGRSPGPRTPWKTPRRGESHLSYATREGLHPTGVGRAAKRGWIVFTCASCGGDIPPGVRKYLGRVGPGATREKLCLGCAAAGKP